MAKITEEELMRASEDFKKEVDLVNLRYTSYLSMLARYVEQENLGKGKKKVK
jgi:hypothetical protein